MPPKQNEENDKRLDRTDRLILKSMIDNGCDGDNWFNTSEIKEFLQDDITWVTVNRRLIRLYQFHYVKRRIAGKIREYDRDGTHVKSERKIEWTLNV